MKGCWDTAATQLLRSQQRREWRRQRRCPTPPPPAAHPHLCRHAAGPPALSMICGRLGGLRLHQHLHGLWQWARHNLRPHRGRHRGVWPCGMPPYFCWDWGNEAGGEKQPKTASSSTRKYTRLLDLRRAAHGQAHGHRAGLVNIGTSEVSPLSQTPGEQRALAIALQEREAPLGAALKGADSKATNFSPSWP